jgi:catechol 2,3-dioxygenase-like lactoylglutathione lyase family enzyme
MPVQLDHLILPVNDRDASVAFYTSILGLEHEGDREPFAIIRVSPIFTLQLAPWGTPGGEHLAFAMPRPEFDAVFRRVREAGIPYGDAFDGVGNQREPADEPGARGIGKSLYFFDPSQHLLEIRHYPDA